MLTFKLQPHTIMQLELARRAAVERQFEVIAEALRRIRVIEPLLLTQTGDCDKFLGLGQALQWNVDDIDYGILWRATARELPRLIDELSDLMARGSYQIGS